MISKTLCVLLIIFNLYLVNQLQVMRRAYDTLTFKENRTWLIGYSLVDVFGYFNVDSDQVAQGLAGAGDLVNIKSR